MRSVVENKIKIYTIGSLINYHHESLRTIEFPHKKDMRKIPGLLLHVRKLNVGHFLCQASMIFPDCEWHDASDAFF